MNNKQITTSTQSELINLLIDHSRIFYSVISDMAVYFLNYVTGNKQELEQKRAKMQLEMEDADLIKNHLIQDFSDIKLFGLGDYISLIIKLDNILDDALRFIETLNIIDFNSLNSNLQREYQTIVNNILKISALTKEAIRSLEDIPETLIFDINEIHQLSSTIEDLIHRFMTHLFNNDDIDLKTTVVILSAIRVLEAILDKINHITDVMRVLGLN
jgi:uncharacterized protein Yka (UPF0111/DUF47 family)